MNSRHLRGMVPIFLGLLCFTNFNAIVHGGKEASPQAVSSRAYNWGDKLKRGALNIISSPVEIARSIHMESEEDGLLQGWTIGLIKGFGNGIVRMGAGFIDLFTFPFNFPDDQKGPLINPEYVWEKPGVKYT